MTRRLFTEQDRQAAVELLDEGLSYTGVGQVLGFSRRTVTAHVPGRGWTQRQGGEYRAMQRWGEKRVDKVWKGRS